jgi:hypothetical protein
VPGIPPGEQPPAAPLRADPRCRPGHQNAPRRWPLTRPKSEPGRRSKIPRLCGGPLSTKKTSVAWSQHVQEGWRRRGGGMENARIRPEPPETPAVQAVGWLLA